MLSLRFIRQNPELVLEAVEERHESTPLGVVLSLDEQHRQLLQQVERLPKKSTLSIGLSKNTSAKFITNPMYTSSPMPLNIASQTAF